MLVDAPDRAYPAIIWCGRNNFNDPTTVKADIAAMVASLPHTNYLVLGLPNASDEPSGSGAWTLITQLNADLAATYGSKFWDVRAYLLTQGNGSAQDNADIANDIPPSSLRTDSVHLNAAGYTLISPIIKSKIGI